MGMWEIQTDIPNADYLQDMVRTDHQITNKNHAHTNKYRSIWIQRRDRYH